MTTLTSASDVHIDRPSADFRALANREWLPLPGGELEAPRARALCPSCRAAGRRALCLNCFRADRNRERQLIAARDFDTASEARFQSSLPFEPVNRARLHQLRAARQAARVEARQGAAGRCVDRRRQAQIAARHALQRLAEGLRARGMAVPVRSASMAAVRGAEGRVPESWLPCVVQSAPGRS